MNEEKEFTDQINRAIQIAKKAIKYQEKTNGLEYKDTAFAGALLLVMIINNDELIDMTLSMAKTIKKSLKKASEKNTGGSL